jgi:excisionase family DNA binding protein
MRTEPSTTTESEPVESRTWMSYEQAADYCGVDRVTIWRSVRAGRLPAGGVGRAVRFHRDDLDAWMRGNDRE